MEDNTNNQFTKQNKRPLKIYYTMKGDAYFNWKKHRKHLKNFLRTHNNPWIGDLHLPEHIHGFETDQYYNPLYIEIIYGADDAVNVYYKQ